MEILGYIGALLIGIVLGLIGGGGSILTVPVLVYILGVDVVLSTAYSLFIVGTTALVGAIQNAFKGMVDFKTGIIFAIPSFIAVFLTRKFLVPAFPEVFFTLGNFEVTKNIGIMIFFAIIMIAASISMIKKPKNQLIEDESQPITYNYPLIALEGLVVGVLTGIVGAGGGFLIIPALVILAKLPMKKAVATSLLIIAAKSLFGFMGDVESLPIDWNFLAIFTSLSVVGIFIGSYLSKFIQGSKLKVAFGWFVLVMGVYIILKEVLK